MTKILLVSNRKAFETEIARLNRRAVKVGFEPLAFEFLRNVETTQRRTVVTTLDGDSEERVTKVPVTVAEYRLTLPDADQFKWELAASITPVDGGKHFVESRVKNFDVTPWESSDPCRCQHCNTNRHRSLTYVIRNRETEQLLQVGRNCFADYVGQEGLLKLEFCAHLFSVFNLDAEDSMWPDASGGKVEVISLRRVIAFAEALAVCEGGWRNNKHDQFGELVSEGTHRVAARYARQNDSGLAKLAESEAIQNATGIILSHLQSLVASADDEFGAALQYLSGFEFIPAKKASLAAYAGEFLRNLNRRAALEIRKATMKHVGTVGKREKFSNLVCEKVVTFDSAFGTCHIHIFADESGNALVWKTNQCVASQGEKLNLKATVKEHSDYKGVPQTILSRCKVV